MAMPTRKNIEKRIALMDLHQNRKTREIERKKIRKLIDKSRVSWAYMFKYPIS